jgi:hypothetical protein
MIVSCTDSITFRRMLVSNISDGSMRRTCGVREMSVHFFFLAFVSSYELFLEEARGLEVVLFVASKLVTLV